MPRELHPRKAKQPARTSLSVEPDPKDPDADSSPLSDVSSDEEARVVKKRKTRRATSKDASLTSRGPLKNKRVKGKLSKLWTLMPIELLCRIYGYLSPSDLIHMSRTCTTFARFLLHPSSHSIWREARELVIGLPECPEDLTEPKYAALCFSSTCNRCGKPNCQQQLWELRRRWCEKCRTAILNGQDEEYKTGWVDIITSQTVRGNHRYSVRVYRKAEYQMYTAIRDSADDQETKDEAIRRIKEKTRSIAVHAQACYSWANNKGRDRSVELAQLRATRVSDIKTKLLEAGWTQVEIDHSLWQRLPNIHVAKPLTTSGWKTLKPILEQRIVADKRETYNFVLSQLEYSVERTFENWVAENSPASVRPDSWHIPMVPEFGDRLKEFINTFSLPYIEARSSFDVDSLFPDLKERFERITKDCLARVTESFSTLFISSFGKTGTSEIVEYEKAAQLTLAIALFRCERDETIGHHFPELWWHGPGQPSRYYQLEGPPIYAQILAWPDSVESEQSWYSFDHKSSNVVREILRARGMSVETTTLAALDADDPRVVCLRCETQQKKVKGLTMSWRAAIKHWAEDHKDLKTPSKWRVLSAEHKARFIATCEEPKVQETPSKYEGLWLCTVCGPGAQHRSLSTMESHYVYSSGHSNVSPEHRHKCRVRSAAGAILPPMEFSPAE